MARPFRIQPTGGRYPGTTRGNEPAILRDDRDRRHFLELLGELPERRAPVPVRVARLGLSPQDRQRQRTAAARDPGDRRVAERLRVLRNYRWSSDRAYVGLEAAHGGRWVEFRDR